MIMFYSPEKVTQVSTVCSSLEYCTVVVYAIYLDFTKLRSSILILKHSALYKLLFLLYGEWNGSVICRNYRLFQNVFLYSLPIAMFNLNITVRLELPKCCALLPW